MLAAVLGGLSVARSHWKLIGIGLLCLALAVQSVRLGHAHNQLEKERIVSNNLRAELQRISTAKNEQAETTKGNIEKAEKGQREADGAAEKIEAAPLPGNCATPPEIMGADL